MDNIGRRFKIIIIFFLFVFTQTSAQQYFFKNYSVENGLPFLQISCMYQDQKGYLWTGGFGGLSRFDGKTFIAYNPKNGLMDRNVNAIHENKSGSIFIGTNKGLSILQGRQFSNYNKANGFENVKVTSFSQGDNNAMYIGTVRGLYIYKNKHFIQLNKFDDYKINCLLRADTMSLFAGTDQGIIIYGSGKFQVLNESHGLASNNVISITRYRNYLVVGTDKGLCFYDLVSHKILSYAIENGLIDEEILDVKNQNDEFLWIGSKSGLLRFDGVQFQYYNVGMDNNSNHVKCILQDREDNIWLGTHSGLFRYRDNSFSTFDKINGPGNAFIYQIFRDKRNDLWVGTNSSGIFKYSQGYFKRYGLKDGLVTNTCRAGIEDHEGRLIFGTQYNLCQFKNNRFYEIALPKEFKGPYETLFESGDKKLWITGSNGVASLVWKNNKAIVRFYPIYAKTDFQVFGICEGARGEMYIGTSHAGLFKLENEKIVNLNALFKMNEDDFFSLRYLKGYLLAPSLNGLLILNTKNNKLKRIAYEDGLSSELAYSIEFAENKSALWIGTNQGINKLNLTKFFNNEEVDVRSFGKQEGFEGGECNTNGIWEDKDGTMWFGTVNGLVKHEPFKFKKNLIENSTLIQAITILNEDTLLGDDLVLPSNYNTLAFYYRGICLTNPDKVMYQKKLEGLEKDWSKPSSEDYSKYANLAPGNYIFKIRSCNNEGVWDTKETSFAFRIKSPFYLTWWFLLLCFILAFAVIYSVFIIRIYYIKRQQKMDFDRKVQMSKVELKALRSQMNPHFIFNSLNSIQHYIFNSKSDEAIKFLNKFARLVRIILNNSDKPTVTVGEDLETLRLYLQLEQMRFEDKFEYEISVDESVDPDYDIMPPLLMQPYVENAILHGLNPMSVKGKLIIRVISENNFLICTITDNGIGRERAAEIKRTMPFSKHRSLGMKITEDRLKILNEINSSQLSVIITDLKSADGSSSGTKVELFVPLNG